MSIFQIVATLFAIFMIYVVNLHQKRLRMRVLEASFWYSIWALFIVVALFPNLLLGVVGLLNFSRVFDLLVVIALMILTTIVIMSYFQQRENSRKLEDYIRKTAIGRISKSHKS